MRHALFLGSDGVVWCMGNNDEGQLGSMEVSRADELVSIDFFIRNNIRIRDMDCGWVHNVMVDYDDRVWVFGDNQYGSLAVEVEVDDGGDAIIPTPRELVVFRDLKVEIIKCGVSHNYVRCAGNKHYLWVVMIRLNVW